MYSSEPDRINFPLTSRRWGIFTGTALMLAAGAALVSARTIPFSLVLLVAAFATAAAARDRASGVTFRRDAVALAFGAFLVYAAASTFWGMDTLHGLAKTALAASIVVFSAGIVRLLQTESRANLLHIAEGLWIGFLIGLLYFLIESLTDQAIKMWVFNALDIAPETLKPARFYTWKDGNIIAIDPTDLTRNATSISLLLWPSLMAVQGTAPQNTNRMMAVAIFVLAAAAAAASTQETSKLALVAGTVTFVLAWMSLRWTARIVAVAWVALCIAIVPFAIVLHKLDLHNASWVQPSAQHRIIIWNYTAERVRQSPVFGVGAHTTYVLGLTDKGSELQQEGEKYTRSVSRHAHNIYLQTWFELGAIGAILLMLSGLALLRLIGTLGSKLQPYGYATFVCVCAVAGASYGMWQIWYMSLFGLTVIAFAAGARALQTVDEGAIARTNCDGDGKIAARS